MGYVIVTVRNLLWMLLSLTAVMALVAAIITPQWIVGYKGYDDRYQSLVNATSMKSPTIGHYNHCSRLQLAGNQRPYRCRRFAKSLSDVPSNFWKASLIFLVFGTSIAAVCVLMALIGFCVQKIGKKALISVVGVIQALAGLFLLIGMVLYPAGWGSENKRFKEYCYKPNDNDNKPSAFKLGECTIGWAFYSALGGTVLVFLCAIFSGQAEKSTSSDKVQDEIWKGKKVICLP